MSKIETTSERIVFADAGGSPLLVIYGEPDFLQSIGWGGATRIFSKSLSVDMTLDARFEHAVAEVDRWSELGKLKDTLEEEARQLRYAKADAKVAEEIAAEKTRREEEERARIASVLGSMGISGFAPGATKDEAGL